MIIQTVFAEWTNKCQNIWWWIAFWCQKKRNLTNNKWCDEKLSLFNNYFQNDENVDKMIYQNGFIVNVFIGQKSVVLKKFNDEKI